MSKFLLKILKQALFLLFFFYLTISPVSARVLVKDGVKLPLVAADNTIDSQIQGKVLVNTEDPLFIDKDREAPSALQIIRSRNLWQNRIEEKESSPARGFESLLNNQGSLNFDSFNSTPTNTFVNPVEPLNLDLIKEELGSLVDSSLNRFSSNPVTFSETLKVLGAVSLASTTVSGPLTQDGTLLISEGRNIDVVGETLNLQSEGLGAIDFIAGKMTLDREGNLVVSGEVAVAGGIKTDFISPLASDAVTVGKNLRVEGQLQADRLSVLGETVLSSLSVSGPVNLQSFAASSYGRMKDLILDQGLIISDKGEAPSVGTATIYAGTQQVIVPNTRVNEKSKIFLSIDASGDQSAISNQQSLSLFVSEKLPGSYFVVSTNQLLEQDLTFNWLMVN